MSDAEAVSKCFTNQHIRFAVLLTLAIITGLNCIPGPAVGSNLVPSSHEWPLCAGTVKLELNGYAALRMTV